MQATLKEVDEQGRIVLPASWRRKHLKGRRVLLRSRGDILEVLPQGDVNLTEFFDAAEVGVRSDLSEWRMVRRELRKR